MTRPTDQTPAEPNLADMSLEQLAVWGRSRSAAFDPAAFHLTTLLAPLDPVAILAKIAYVTLCVELRRLHGLSSADEFAAEAQQLHVEVLQAFALARPRDSSTRSPNDDDLRAVWHALADTAAAYRDRPIALVAENANPDQRAEVAAAFGIAAHAFGTRNVGYPHQIERMLIELLAPLDAPVDAARSVRPTQLARLWFGLKTCVEDRVWHVMQAYRAVGEATTLGEVDVILRRAFPAVAVQHPHLFLRLRTPGLSHEDFEAATLDVFDAQLPRVFTLTMEELRVAAAGPEGPPAAEPLRAVLAEWSAAFGDVYGTSPSQLLFRNPVWERPLIRLEEDVYFVPVHAIGSHVAFSLISAWLEQIPGISDLFGKRRGDYLEERTVALLTDALPGAAITRGSEHPPVTWTFENDATTVLDTYVLVVEAKAAGVPAAARRGDIPRIKATLKRGIEYAARQAATFVVQITPRARHKLRQKGRRGAWNIIDTTRARRITRLSVTLDQLGTLGARWADLVAAGLIDPSVPPTPTMHLLELECVLEVLRRPAEVLHYLSRRERAEYQRLLQGDELDLLDQYLETGLVPIPGPVDGRPVSLWGRSDSFARYFLAQSRNSVEERPKSCRSMWWSGLLDSLEAQRPDGWLRSSEILLSVPMGEQNGLEGQVLALASAVRMRGELPSFDHVSLARTDSEDPWELVLVVANLDPAARADLAKALASEVTRVQQADNSAGDTLVIVVDAATVHPGDAKFATSGSTTPPPVRLKGM